jgi:DtxR family Mn-dependent transcriptional regulator
MEVHTNRMRKITESYEDYLKAIYLISKRNKGGWCSNSEISEILNVKPPSVSNMLYKLKENDYIDWAPRKSIRLTRKGKMIAEETLQSYEILKEFFSNILNIDDDSLVEKLSCEIEHHLTPDVSEAIQNLIH